MVIQDAFSSVTLFIVLFFKCTALQEIPTRNPHRIVGKTSFGFTLEHDNNRNLYQPYPTLNSQRAQPQRIKESGHLLGRNPKLKQKSKSKHAKDTAQAASTAPSHALLGVLNLGRGLPSTVCTYFYVQ
jgi:hypothetical protein